MQRYTPFPRYMDSCKVAVFFHRLKMQSVPEKPFLHDENKKPEAEN